MGEQRGLAPLLTVDLAPVTVELNLRESGARFPCKWSSVLEIYTAETMYSLLMALAIGLILLGWVWNLFKNYGLGLGVDAEDPVKLTAKAILFIVLAYYADEIVNIALTIGGTPYAWILSSELPSLDFASFKSVMLTIIGVCANGGVALIVLILTLILAWNYIKLLFEAAERYVLLGVLVYLSLIHISEPTRP